jgi:rhodanese-related sulfurtransferase
MWKLQISVLSLLAAVFTVFVAALPVFAGQTNYNGNASADVVHKLARSNQIKLIDIRRPSEWRQTGVGQSTHKISMHQAGFVDRIDALVDGDRTKPVALICARSNRSTWMKEKLNSLGFTNVTNVSEDMLGSKAGLGWLKRNLPTK